MSAFNIDKSPNPGTTAQRDENGRLKAAEGVDSDDVATVAQLGGGSDFFSGSFNTAGAIEYLPPGWSYTSTSDSAGEVTHNLGTTNYDAGISMSTFQAAVPSIINKSANAFSVRKEGSADADVSIWVKIRPAP